MTDISTEVRRSPLVLRIIRFPLCLLVIGVALWVGAQVLAGTIGKQLGGSGPLGRGGSGPVDVVEALIVAGLVIAAYWILRRFVEGEPVDDLTGPGKTRELLIGIGVGAGLFATVATIAALVGVYRHDGFNDWRTVWPLLAIAITSGVGEEVLLRGIIFRLIEKLGGTWIALAVSAAIFGAAHLFNPASSWVAVIAIAIEAGILLGAIYMLTRRLWAAIGLHAAWNFTQGWVFGVPVSGFKLPGLVQGRTSGPEWLSGGAFGLEAGAIALLVAGSAGLWVLWVAVRKGEIRKRSWSWSGNAPQPAPQPASQPPLGVSPAES